MEILGSRDQIESRRLQKLTNAGAVRRKPIKTALEDGLNDETALWLVQHAKDRWDALYSSLSSYRERREIYEMQMREDFEWRLRKDSRHPDAADTIFQLNNDTLNVVGSFRDFLAAQTKNDIFGAKPWFSVQPEGKADAALAEDIQRHFSFKLKKNNLEDTYLEAIDLATGLGEAFVKTTWRVDTDTYERAVSVLHSNGKPVVTPLGEYIYSDDEIIDERQEQEEEEGVEEEEENVPRGNSKAEPKIYAKKAPSFALPTDGEFSVVYEEATTVIKNGIDAQCLYYRDVAFDPTARELDLLHTDFFCQFQIGAKDAKIQYDLTNEQYEKLKQSSGLGETETEAYKPRTNNEDSADGLSGNSPGADLESDNPPVHLVEGYMRCDPIGDGKLRRIYLVFSVEEEMILFADYLSNVTPDGSLPVCVHRIYPISGRMYGAGMFERYEYLQEYVDDLFNQITWRNRNHANPVVAYDPHGLEMEEEDAKFEFAPGKTYKLKEGAKLDNVIQTAQLPDLDSRTMDLAQLAIQFGQMRTGISSATQGEMSSLPQNNTATGIQAMMSRAAILLKDPIDNLKKSLTRDMRYAVKLTYARFNQAEAFVYGEGENQEMVELSADQVKGLELDIKLLMTQAQNVEKLDNAKAAIDVISSYIQIPEHEKVASRNLYLQALKALNFDNADEIVREAVTDPQQLLEILPPELQQPFAAFMEQMASQQAPQVEGGNVEEFPNSKKVANI